MGDNDDDVITLEEKQQQDFFLKQMWKIGMMYTNDYFTIEKYFCRNYPGGYSDLLPNSPRLYLTSDGPEKDGLKIKKLISKNFYLQIQGKNQVYSISRHLVLWFTLSIL